MDMFLMILFLIVCLLLIIVVLLQKGRGGGLGSAFGGAGSSAFGTRTGDVFTWVTIVLTGLFLLLAIFATMAVRPDIGQVAAPVFAPASWPKGHEADDIKVTIKVATKGAAIRYTTNGKEPTDKSLKYGMSAVLVKRDQTLKARAFRAGLEPSGTLTVTYAPPKPEPQSAPAAGRATTAPASQVTE
ncbi:MAG: preprotein translocase subunit SecG [Candidatus Hydrogenedentes bacterium]|nr:preprotein translocase subunit SecG [Candidatus Hydrogenedentota bacterium]